MIAVNEEKRNMKPGFYAAQATLQGTSKFLEQVTRDFVKGENPPKEELSIISKAVEDFEEGRYAESFEKSQQGMLLVLKKEASWLKDWLAKHLGSGEDRQRRVALLEQASSAFEDRLIRAEQEAQEAKETGQKPKWVAPIDLRRLYEAAKEAEQRKTQRRSSINDLRKILQGLA